MSSAALDAFARVSFEVAAVEPFARMPVGAIGRIAVKDKHTFD